MKKLTGFLFFLVVFVLGAYYFMGVMTYKTLNKHIKALNPSPFYSLQLNDYEQGWFCSTAVLGISIHIPPQTTVSTNGEKKLSPPSEIQFNLPLKIKHGPFISTKNGLRFGLSQVMTKPESNYGFLIDYFNRSIFEYALPSFSMTVKTDKPDQPFLSSWDGFRTRLSASPGFEHLTGYFTLMGLHVIANHVDFNMGEINYEFNLTHALDGLFLGDGNITLDKITVKSDDGQYFELDKLGFLVRSSLTEGDLSFNVEASLQKLSLDNKYYGPGEFKLSLTGLDPEAMAKIYKQLGLISDKNQSNIAMLAIMTELPKLVSKGTKLEFSESLSLPEGKITGHMTLSLPNTIAQDPSQLAKVKGSGQFRAPMLVIKKAVMASISKKQKEQPPKPAPETLSTTSPGQTPEPMAAVQPIDPKIQAEKAIESLVNQGILKVDGQDYVIDFQFENQQFMVNGKPFNPASLNEL